MQLVWQSFGEAWATLKRNWVVVWFPFLVGLGIVIALTIVLVVITLGSGIAQNWPLVLDGDWAAMSGLVTGLAGFALVALLAMMVLVAGQTHMQARASAGETVSTEDFAQGVRRFYWRFLGGNLLLFVVGAVLAVIFFGGMLQQLFYYAQANPDLPLEGLLPWMVQTAPMALVGFLLFLVAGLLLSMWPRLVTVEDMGTIPAMLGSIRLVGSKLGPFLVFGIINWAVSLLAQRIGEGNAFVSLLMLAFNLAWTSYYSLALFIFYRHLIGALPAEPQEPPTL